MAFAGILGSASAATINLSTSSKSLITAFNNGDEKKGDKKKEKDKDKSCCKKDGKACCKKKAESTKESSNATKK